MTSTAPGAAAAPAAPAPVSLARIASAWWPLAASWLLMGVEMPLVSAVIARLPDPRVHLAAYGGIVFPLAMLIEAPVIMLLATSTALSRDRVSYRLIHRFTHALGAGMTALHVLVAFTPLYDFVAVRLLDVPPECLEPGRLGLRLMTPWTWSIASRRFQQGVLIRFGRSRSVGAGTLVRLASEASVLALGYALGRWPGVAVGTAAVATGVMAEAAWVALRLRPLLGRLDPAGEGRPAERLTLGGLVAFHAPLALTSTLTLVLAPVASAAMGRLPSTLASLAAWPVVSGLAFLFRSLGFAFNEVAVVLLEQPGARRALGRFTLLAGGATTAALAAIAATPLAPAYLERVAGLSPELARFAGRALWAAVPLPALAFAVSLFQAQHLHRRRTRPVSEALVLSLAANVLLLAAAIRTGAAAGLHVAIGAQVVGTLLQAGWLAARARLSRPGSPAARPRPAATPPRARAARARG
jgi:hypothetical protein